MTALNFDPPAPSDSSSFALAEAPLEVAETPSLGLAEVEPAPAPRLVAISSAVAETRPRRTLVPIFVAPPEEPLREPYLDVVVVTVPALNEAQFISRVVGDVIERGFECVVIDDGSTDDTAAIARRAGAVVVRHPITLGQGAALQTGIEWALARGADMIVTFDGDGQHRASDIPVLLERLRVDDADFALGSRFLGEAVNIPPLRRLLLRAAVLYTRLATGMKVTDTHNGLRAMTRRGAMAMRLRQQGMAHASEILNQIAQSRLSWIEVPVTIEYSAQSLAKGQANGDFLAILVDLLMGRLAR